MPRYSTNNALGGTQQNVAATYKTLVSAFASNATQLRRGKVYDVLIGTNGTPADNVMTFDISRMTADGTGTTVTPVSLDPADAAMLGVSKANYTAEPTVTAASSVFNLGINQRASYRWVAAPGSELIYPATNANGLVLRVLSPGYTGTATAEIMLEE